MKKWRCRYCAHVYDEALGDPAAGIAPGTRLADLPDDWVCPDCGAGRDDYDLVEE